MWAGEDAVDPLKVFEDRTIQFTGEEYKDETFHYRLMKPPMRSPNICPIVSGEKARRSSTAI